jgi:hypothetical protein
MLSIPLYAAGASQQTYLPRTEPDKIEELLEFYTRRFAPENRGL